MVFIFFDNLILIRIYYFLVNIWENDMLCVRELGMRITNTKERLILAAIELFSTKGYEGTSVEEIAKAVGIKAPSIYDHFKGKEALLYAVRDYADIVYDKGMQFSRVQSETVCSNDGFKEFTMQLIEFTLNNDIARKMRRMMTIEQFRNEFFTEMATKRNVTVLKDIYANVFTRLMDLEIMQRGNPDIYALQFISPVTLMIQLCDREPNRKDEALEIVSEHIDVFMQKYFTKG